MDEKALQERLVRDYAAGKSYTYLRATYGLSKAELDDFAEVHGLVHGSVQRDTDDATPPCRAVAKPKFDKDAVDAALVKVEENDAARRDSRKTVGRTLNDGVAEIAGLLQKALLVEMKAAVEPVEDMHPARRDVQAARSLRGKNESVYDATLKIANVVKATVEIEQANEEAFAQGANITVDNRQVNIINGSPDGPVIGNTTAIDAKSKLAAVLGRVEVLRKRKREKEDGRVVDVG
jgi:hypothetical protein